MGRGLLGSSRRNAERATPTEPDLLLAATGLQETRHVRFGQTVALDQRDPAAFSNGRNSSTGSGAEPGEGGFHARDIGISPGRAITGGDGRLGTADDDMSPSSVSDQFPEMIEHPPPRLALRGAAVIMVPPRGDHRHQDDVTGEDAEKQRQGADHVVLFVEQKRFVADPAVCRFIPDSCCWATLGHAGGAAGVEIGGDAVALRILVRSGGHGGCFATSEDHVDDAGRGWPVGFFGRMRER